MKGTSALVGYAGCVPEQVGADLARALAGACCAGRHHAARPCEDCTAVGHTLARPVAGLLFAARAPVGFRSRSWTPRDLEAIGRALETLEQAAGTFRFERLSIHEQAVR